MIGLSAGGGSPVFLPRVLPPGKAMQMLMTGDPITAKEAHRLGMVNEIHQQSELMPAAYRIAEKIASNSPTAVRAVKRAVGLGHGQPTEQAIATMMEAHWRSPSTPTGSRASARFNEDRDPTFQDSDYYEQDTSPQGRPTWISSRQLERERAALTMIDAQPFNAEAPPEALETDITPTQRHYIRSNFPVPDHDGRLEIGGAVEQPHTLTLDDLKAMLPSSGWSRSSAGNGASAMRPLPAGEPWGDYAVSTRLGPARYCTNARDAKPLTAPLRCCSPARTMGRTSSPGAQGHRRIRPPSNGRRRWFMQRILRLEILIAYEMNGEPLNPDHGSPFRLIVPHWYGSLLVKWLKRIELLTQPFIGEFEPVTTCTSGPIGPPERDPHAPPRAASRILAAAPRFVPASRASYAGRRGQARAP